MVASVQLFLKLARQMVTSWGNRMLHVIWAVSRQGADGHVHRMADGGWVETEARLVWSGTSPPQIKALLLLLHTCMAGLLQEGGAKWLQAMQRHRCQAISIALSGGCNGWTLLVALAAVAGRVASERLLL